MQRKRQFITKKSTYISRCYDIQSHEFWCWICHEQSECERSDNGALRYFIFQHSKQKSRRSQQEHEKRECNYTPFLVRLINEPAHLAPRVGFEPTTLRLTAGCSAAELTRNIQIAFVYYHLYDFLSIILHYFFTESTKSFSRASLVNK